MFSILNRKGQAGTSSRRQDGRQTHREKKHRRKLQKPCPRQVAAQFVQLPQDQQEGHADHTGSADCPQNDYGDDADYLRTSFDNHGDNPYDHPLRDSFVPYAEVAGHHKEAPRFIAVGYYQSPNVGAHHPGDKAGIHSSTNHGHVHGRGPTPYPFSAEESHWVGDTSDYNAKTNQRHVRDRVPTPYPAMGEIVVRIPREPLGSSTPKRAQGVKGKERSGQALAGGHPGHELSHTEVHARQKEEMERIFQEYRVKLERARDLEEDGHRATYETHAKLLNVFASENEEPHHQNKHAQPSDGLDFFKAAPDGMVRPHISFAREPKREDLDQEMYDEDVEMPDQPALIPVQSSLYGARNVRQLSSTIFEDAGFTPTSRLDYWLYDVEGHSERRRAEIAEQNKNLDLHPPPAWNFDAYINETQFGQGDQDTEMLGDQQELQVPLTRNRAPYDITMTNIGTEKHKRSEDDAEDGPAMKRSRRASIFDTLKRGISIKQGDGDVNSTSRRLSAASRRLSGMRHSAMGIFGRATPSFMLQIHQDVPDKPLENFRFAVVRGSMAGKSALVERFAEGTYSNVYKISSWSSTIGTLDMDTCRASIELWDVSASSQISGTNPLVMTYFHTVFICYSVEDEKNLASVAEVWQYIVRSYCENVPIFVVGLKKDLRKDAPTLKLRFLHEPSPASRAQGELMAKQINAAAFSEVSAKTGEGVNELFEDAVRLAMSIRKIQDKERAERLRREKVKGAVAEAGKRASELFCFQGNI